MGRRMKPCYSGKCHWRDIRAYEWYKNFKENPPYWYQCDGKCGFYIKYEKDKKCIKSDAGEKFYCKVCYDYEIRKYGK